MTPVDYLVGSNFDLAFQSLHSDLSALTSALDTFNTDFKVAFTFVAVALVVTVIISVFTMMRSR